MNLTLWLLILYGLSDAQVVHIFETFPRGMGLPVTTRWCSQALPSME